MLLPTALPRPEGSDRLCLTVRMLARLQGFPDSWEFCGSKTQRCRQNRERAPSAANGSDSHGGGSMPERLTGKKGIMGYLRTRVGQVVQHTRTI